MPKFRKKPVEIEAMQYTLDKREELIAWSGAIHTAIDDDEGVEYELESLRIVTLEGTMRVSLGDWVIRGVQGEFYPVKDEIFRSTYEPVRYREPE